MLVPAHSLLIGTNVYPKSRHALLLTPLNLITCIVCMKQLLVSERIELSMIWRIILMEKGSFYSRSYKYSSKQYVICWVALKSIFLLCFWDSSLYSYLFIDYIFMKCSTIFSSPIYYQTAKPPCYPFLFPSILIQLHQYYPCFDISRYRSSKLSHH